MHDTDLQVLSSPGSLTESEIGIILKSQQDFQDLLKQIQQKDKRIEKLKWQLEKSNEAFTSDNSVVSNLAAFASGVLFSLVIAFVVVGYSAYEMGVSDGLKYKQQFCQIKHPRSASAYQRCINQ